MYITFSDSPLLEALEKSDHSDIKFYLTHLLKAGFKVNSLTVPKEGESISALHYAAYRRSAFSVQLLLEAGADPHMEGKWDKLKGTPYRWAKEQNDKVAWEKLEKAMAEDTYRSEEDLNSLPGMMKVSKWAFLYLYT